MDLSDDEIILIIRKNLLEAMDMLLLRYQKHINYLSNKIIKKSPYCGLDVDDLKVVGISSLFLALENYEMNKSLFYAFWNLLCEREMHRLIGKNCSLSQGFLNNSLSVDYQYNEDEFTILDCIGDDNEKIVDTLIFKEELANYENEICKELSELDLKILRLQLSGFSYKEIADICDCKYSHILHILRKCKKINKRI